MGVQTVEGRRSGDVLKREWLRACLAEENDFWRLPQAGVPHSQVGKGVEIKRGGNWRECLGHAMHPPPWQIQNMQNLGLGSMPY